LELVDRAALVKAQIIQTATTELTAVNLVLVHLQSLAVAVVAVVGM